MFVEDEADDEADEAGGFTANMSVDDDADEPDVNESFVLVAAFCAVCAVCAAIAVALADAAC